MGLEIKEISSDSFKGLSQLEKLSLAYNQISKLYPGTFDYLVSLKELCLDINNLSYLEPGLFRSLNKLKVLKLNDNRLKADLHENTYLGLENLDSFYVSCH
jgi:hypothetical protein